MWPGYTDGKPRKISKDASMLLGLMWGSFFERYEFCPTGATGTETGFYSAPRDRNRNRNEERRVAAYKAALLHSFHPDPAFVVKHRAIPSPLIREEHYGSVRKKPQMQTLCSVANRKDGA